MMSRVEQGLIGLAILVFVWLLIGLSIPFNRRRSRGQYVSGNDRAWQEHPAWIVLAILAGLVVAILTIH